MNVRIDLTTMTATPYEPPCREELAERRGQSHDCWDNAVPYTNSGGALGHGWECGVCGKFLQAG